MSAPPPVRVLVADDHTVVRQGIVNLLNASEDVEVVAEASDGAEAMRRALETRPDVAVLDVSMPRLNGIEAARRIHEALPRTRILVLTMHDEEEYVVRMVRAGASGYILKDGVVSELIAGILAVSRGNQFFAPETIAARARRASQALPSREADPYESLTDRERDVFHLVVEGLTNAQVAAVLAISPKTVDNHRTRLMEKLGLHSVAELVRYAAKNHLDTSLRDSAGSGPSAHRRSARPDAASTARLTPRNRYAPAARASSPLGDFARRERKP